tara:strand:- start:387 stop:602 length:216 start_codon:yes stop_codon:yes gene_type:complete
MEYTLHSVYEDRRFGPHPLRCERKCAEAWSSEKWKFTTTVLGKKGRERRWQDRPSISRNVFRADVSPPAYR